MVLYFVATAATEQTLLLKYFSFNRCWLIINSFKIKSFGPILTSSIYCEACLPVLEVFSASLIRHSAESRTSSFSSGEGCWLRYQRVWYILAPFWAWRRVARIVAAIIHSCLNVTAPACSDQPAMAMLSVTKVTYGYCSTNTKVFIFVVVL